MLNINKQTSMRVFLLSLSLLALLSCQSQEKPPLSDEQIKQYRENLVQAHRYLVGKDADSIRKIVKQRKWNMTETQTGMFIEVLSHGAGDSVKTSDRVSLKYKLSLLNNTLCYSSDSLGVKEFTVGQGGVEAGLEEAVLLLCKGDKARLVLPPHLAYGVPGDMKCIPRMAILIYEIEVVALTKKKK